MSTIGQRIAGVVAVAAAAAGMTLATPGVVALVDRVTPVEGYPLAAYVPPCVEEDGSGGPVPCLWDGTRMGNGVGRSYVVTRTDLPD